MTQDAIWNAVEAAQCSHWSAEQFRRECAEAWREGLKRQAEDDEKAWRK